MRNHKNNIEIIEGDLLEKEACQWGIVVRHSERPVTGHYYAPLSRRIYQLLHVESAFWDADYYHGVAHMQVDPGSSCCFLLL